MSCPKSILISAYLDKELQDSGRDALEAHVQGCAQCGAALLDMRSLRAAFANRPRYQAPYGFATRVITRAAGLDKEKASWFAPYFVRFAEAAVLVIVITVGVLAGRVMTNSSLSAQPANIASSFSLDMFDANLPGSPGGAYLAMIEARNEK